MADQNINIKLLIDAADAAKSVAETKKALRDLKTAALSVEEGSQSFIDISTAAGQLQDKIGDLSATTKYLGDDLKNLKGFTSIASGIAGAFAAAQGAAALFGGENKQLEASLLKVQSAMSILQGVQAVGEVLQKESAASLIVQNGLRKTAIALAGEEAIAKAAVAVANGTATITQRALNAAMTANPVIALVAILVTATAALLAFSNNSKEASESQKALNDSISKTKLDAEIEIKTFNSQIEALKKMKTGSEDRAIAIKKINDQYGTTLKNLTDEKDFLKQVNAEVLNYTTYAKARLTTKLNETRAENYLKLAQEERYKITQKQKDIDYIRTKQQAAQNAGNLALVGQLKQTEQALQEELNTVKKVALGYEAKAEKVLAVNGDLLVKESAQQKTAREKEEADAVKAEKDKAKAVADEKAKTNKTKEKTEEEHLKKLADINEEYQQALANLTTETNDSLYEQQKILLSIGADTELNAIQLKNLEIEKQKTDELKNQQDELKKLVDIQVKIFESQNNNVKATPAQVEDITKKEAATTQYADFLQGSNAIIAAITKSGEQAVLDIQKDYAEKRKKVFEDTTRRVLATDEYQRFIDFLNKTKELQNKLQAYTDKFGKETSSLFMSADIQSVIDSNARKEANENIIKEGERVLKSKERDIEYQKELNKGLVDSDFLAYQALIKNIEDANAKTIAKIKEAKQSLSEDPPNLKLPGAVTEQPATIPQSTAVEDLQKSYNKWKDITKSVEEQTKKLFDLQRESNLDQLGNNQKSIEILSALYGEKFNIVKNGENKINEILAKLPVKSPMKPIEFAFVPKEGQIGLKELLELENADIKKAMDALNIDLDKSYQENFDNEKKYFEKSIFENYNTQQQKLADNKAALANGEIKKSEYNKNVLAIDKTFNDTEKNLKENHEENQLAIGVTYGEKTQEDVVTFGKDRLAEKQRIADEEKEIEDKKNAYLREAGQSLYNTLRSFVDDYGQHKLEVLAQEQEDRLAAIDAELLDFDNRDKVITAAEQAKIDERKVIEDKRAAAQAEYDKKVREEKTKQFNTQKAMDIIQIGINTSIAVSASLAPPLLAMVPFIIAAGAAEAFFVAAQQPNFAEGGLVTGPGGPKDDMIKANLSNGEVVINAKSSKKYARMLDAINQAGGGTPIPFAGTPMVSEPTQQQPGVDMEDFKSLILDIVNRPIETYVKESSITNAQKSQSQQNRRTSF